MPTPDWSPPDGIDPKLGRLDAIACGDGTCGTFLTPDWLPFAHGLRFPLPEARPLEYGVLDEGEYRYVPRQRQNWQLYASLNAWRSPFGAISPDNRWVIRGSTLRSLVVRASASITTERDPRGTGQRARGWRFCLDGSWLLGEASAEWRMGGTPDREPGAILRLHIPSGHIHVVLETPSQADHVERDESIVWTSNPSGMVALVGRDTVTVADAFRDTPPIRFSHGFGEEPVRRVALSLDGTRVALVGSSGQRSCVFDVATGDLLAWPTPQAAMYPGFAAWMGFVAFARDHRYLVTSGSGTTVHDLEHNDTAWTFPGEVEVVATTPCLSRLALLDPDFRLTVVDFDPTWREPGPPLLEGKLPRPHAWEDSRWPPPSDTVELSPDGRLFAIDNPRMLVDVEQRSRLSLPLAWFDLSSGRVAWTRDSDTLVTGAGVLIRADDCRPFTAVGGLNGRVVLAQPGQPIGIASPTPAHAGPVDFVDLASCQFLERAGTATSGARFIGPDGRRVLAYPLVIDLEARESIDLRLFPSIESAGFVAIGSSPDGSRLAFAGNRLVVLDLAQERIVLDVPLRYQPRVDVISREVVDAITGNVTREVTTRPRIDEDPFRVGFSPDGAIAVTERSDSHLECWRIDDATRLDDLDTRIVWSDWTSARPADEVPSPDGRRLAVLSREGLHIYVNTRD